MQAEPAHRRWYRRPRRVSLIVVLLVVLVGGVAFGILWSRRGAHEASLQSAVDKFRKQGQTGDAAFLRPAVGVYTYEGTGTEKLSVLATTQHWGPRLPATVTRGAKDCWTLRVEYSTNHYQEWDECPTKDALQETGGRTYQSFDFVAAHISDLNEFKCTPRGDTIRVKAQPGQRWRVSCDGHSTSRGTTVTSAGTNTYVGPTTITIGGTRVPAYHYRLDRTLTGSQTGSDHTDMWYSARDGLPLRARREVRVESPSPVGAIVYNERGDFTLSSLSPKR